MYPNYAAITVSLYGFDMKPTSCYDINDSREDRKRLQERLQCRSHICIYCFVSVKDRSFITVSSGGAEGKIWPLNTPSPKLL